MKINFSGNIRNIKNDADLLEQQLGTGPGTELPQVLQAIPVAAVVSLALLETYPDETLTDKEKYERFKLAQRVETAGVEDVELTTEEATLIRKLTGKKFVPLISGQIYQLIEG
jgi:hypothetical protein